MFCVFGGEKLKIKSRDREWKSTKGRDNKTIWRNILH